MGDQTLPVGFLSMSFFYHGEPPNPTKRCRFLNSTLLKDAFAYCHTRHRRLSSSKPDEEDLARDMDDELEVVTDAVVISEIRSRAMEAKLRRKASFTTIDKASFTIDGFSRLFSPATGELFVAPKAVRKNDGDDDREGREEFFSVDSCFSRCSSARSMEAFVSVKTSFSRSSSLSELDRRRDFRPPFLLQEFWQDGLYCQDLRQRRAIIQEFCNCDGWPFGLCRKALLLPPLPKSPSESWSWSKGARLVKLP